jgi:hypothetical protein
MPEREHVWELAPGEESLRVGAGTGASTEEAAGPTGRSGVWPVRTIRRHPGTSVLAAGALVALAGGAVLGGWVTPVPVSLPGTHTMLVDPSAHSDRQSAIPAAPLMLPSTSTTAAPPPSAPAGVSTGTPAPGSADPGPAQSAPNGSPSTTPSGATSSTGSGSDSSGPGGPAASAGALSGPPPGGGGTASGPPPVTTPPTTAPGGGANSGGLGALSGILGQIFGSH